jgi:hypothetical protein
LSGTYGSASNSVKIDNIVVDSLGHITSITTGDTGSMSYWDFYVNGVFKEQVGHDENMNFAAGSGITLSGTTTTNPTLTITNSITNNNQLTNGAGYVTSSGLTLAGNGLSASGPNVFIGTPSSITGSSTNATTSSSHTHLLNADPNDVISTFGSINITGTYPWNITGSGSNKYDLALNSGAITINVLTADSGMSGMMRLNTGGSATTLTLQYNGSTSNVYIDSGANLILAINSVYFLTFVQSGGNYIFNLAKYKTQ